MNEFKKCVFCNLVKLNIEFRGNKCRECYVLGRKQYYKKNKTRIKQKVKLYVQNNSEKVKASRKKHVEKNKNKIALEQKKYRIQNKDKIKKRQQSYYQKNKDHIKKKSKIFAEKNPEKIKIYKRKSKAKNKKQYAIKNNLYIKNKKKNNPIFKLQQLVSVSICNALRRVNSSKRGKTHSQYLSYAIQDLKQHLESQFEPWMNWNNHGLYSPKTWNDNDSTTWTWQLDHIIPHSKLKYSSVDDPNFKKCWALDNLRPYSAKQNVIDNNRR